MKRKLRKDESFVIEDVILGRATPEEIELFKYNFPVFQCCGQHEYVYVPQLKKKVLMTFLYRQTEHFWVAAQKSQGVIIAYTVAFNVQKSEFVAFYRVDSP